MLKLFLQEKLPYINGIINESFKEPCIVASFQKTMAVIKKSRIVVLNLGLQENVKLK